LTVENVTVRPFGATVLVEADAPWELQHHGRRRFIGASSAIAPNRQDVVPHVLAELLHPPPERALVEASYPVIVQVRHFEVNNRVHL
jgi:hypothetical protein